MHAPVREPGEAGVRTRRIGRLLAAVMWLLPAVAQAQIVGGMCRPGFIEIPPELRAAGVANADAADAEPDNAAPFTFEADRIDTSESQIALTGGARIAHGGRALFAERIVYERAAARATAAGAVVFYTARGARLSADEMTVDLDTWTGEARAVSLALARRPWAAQASAAESAPSSPTTIASRARATADSVQFNGDDSQLLQRVTLTACAPGNRDVELRAREIVLDHAAGVGRAKAMTVRFKGVPVFYFPAATFPIDAARKSGFLFPAAGYAGDGGAMLEAPYYLNLAPNYDATVTPRVWGRRGAQLAGEFRYLSRRGQSQIDGEFLPSDNNYDGDDDDRYALRFRHSHRPGPNWRARIDWNAVSDEEYARDFSSEIDVVASSYLQRVARLDYAAANRRFGEVRLSAQAAAYESNDRAIARAERPYHRRPQLDFAWQSAFGVLRVGVDAQYADFQHDHCAAGAGADAVPCGSRLRVQPWLSAPLRRSFGYLEPRLSWASIRYSLDERAPGLRASPAVELPIFSLDGGLYFDRRLRFGNPGGAAFTQTLEPRLRYVNIPEKRAQRAFPAFDTAVGGGGSFAQLFRDNRFFGGDRIGDTEQVAAGVTSRVIDAGGRQRLQLSLGRIIYLQDRKIGFDAAAAPETWAASGWFAAAAAALPGNWRTHWFAREHARDNALAWFRAAVQYDDGRGRQGRRAALAYTFKDAAGARAQTEQVSAAFAVPLGARWRAQARGAYSLETDEFHAATVGVEFDGCCWAVRAAASRALDGAGAHQNRFRLTFELDGLGGLNSAP